MPIAAAVQNASKTCDAATKQNCRQTCHSVHTRNRRLNIDLRSSLLGLTELSGSALLESTVTDRLRAQKFKAFSPADDSPPEARLDHAHRL